MTVTERRCDVLVLGAGLAGGLMTRLLRLQQPDLSVINIDRKKEFDYWIGESTVEVFADYAERVLKLGPYLQRHHIIKHGLRFFFDSEKKDLRMRELSETGRGRYQGPVPSYQLDRARFDQDIADMNRELGAEVHLGVHVLAKKSDADPDPIVIDRDGGHLVQTSIGPIRCRWLIDACGRSSPLTKLHGSVEKDPRHPVSSTWCRFKNFEVLDELGDKEWKRRVENTIRYNSTNHFMYRGYWIWHIPLDENLVSIGVSYHREMTPIRLRNGQELLSWLRTHKCFDEILGPKTEVVDFLHFEDVARCAKKQFSGDRWFLTGMSGVVVDAYLSQTCVFNSYSNRLINELIKTDRSGDEARFKRQAEHFSIFMQMKYESLLQSTKYDLFGSYDSFIGWRTARQNVYWNREIPLSTSDLKQIIDTANAHGDDCGCSFERAKRDWEDNSCSAALNRIADEYVAFARETSTYYELNKDHWCESTERFSLGNKVHDERDFELELEEDRLTYEASFRYYTRRMLETERAPFREDIFREVFIADWAKKQTLRAVVDAIKSATGPVLQHEDSVVFWHPKGPIDEQTLREHRWYTMVTPSRPDAQPRRSTPRVMRSAVSAAAVPDSSGAA